MAQNIRSAKKLLLLAVASALSAGCAQTSGVYIAGDNSSPLVWPTPKVDLTPPPAPPEPTLLPPAVMPAAPADAQPLLNSTPSRAAAPRSGSAATLAAPSAAPRPAVSKVATQSGPRDVWQRVRNGLRMAPLDSQLVGDWENYYASRPDYFARMIENSSHFLYHIAGEVEKRNMPLEIALLPMIESAYNPVAYSSAHASGIWQFIPSTGKNYGLKQNWWYDGRRDVIAATSAALDYLQTLYGMFNDWELALAAYNWGEGAVQRAIDRNQAKGLSTDYRSLENMPAETRNYLPKLIAVKNIIANPGRFGITLAHVPNEPYFEVVTVKRHIDVKLAAQFAEMSLEEFKFLNPAHNKPVINANSAETIVLPKHKLAGFMAAMNQHQDKPLVSTKTHTVQAGELPQTIAEKYGIDVATLNGMNGIGPRRRISTGQTLVVPNLTDLQPALEDRPVVTVQAAPRAYVRTVMQKIVVVRGGVRRTVTVAVPAHLVNIPRVPLRGVANVRGNTAVAINKGRAAVPARLSHTARPGAQKIAYNPAAAKINRR
jgi:soluble lytic murein transglycosylase-like protein/LysM repeat protein